MHVPYAQHIFQVRIPHPCARIRQNNSVQLGDQQLRVPFGVVHNLSEPMLVETKFIDRFVKKLLPMECPVLRVQSDLVAFSPSKGHRRTCKLYYRLMRTLSAKPPMERTALTECQYSEFWNALQICRIQKCLYQSRPAVPDSSTWHHTLNRWATEWSCKPWWLPPPCYTCQCQ